MYDTPGVFLHHRMNSILSGEDIKRFKLGNSLKKYAPPPRVEGEGDGSGVLRGALSVVGGPCFAWTSPRRRRTRI